MKFGLTDGQLAQIRSVLAEFPSVSEAVIFGSRAMGNHKEASDVDLALKGEIDGRVVSEIKSAFEDTNIPLFFDIVAYGTIGNDKLKRHIDEHGVVVCRNERPDPA